MVSKVPYIFLLHARHFDSWLSAAFFGASACVHGYINIGKN